MRKIKGILVRAYGEDRIQEYNLEYDGIDSIYKLLDIRCFDIQERMIGNHCYDIYCDDEALLKDPIPNRTYITVGEFGTLEKFYGSIFICRHTEDGEIKSLTRDDIRNIYANSYHTYIVGHLHYELEGVE